jgi:hypothetical protein
VSENQLDAKISEENEVASARVIDLASLGEEAAPDYFYAQSERFLVRNPAGRWLALSASSYKRILASRGISTKRGNGEVMSEGDHVIIQTQLENDIARYGPLCGRNAGFYVENSIRHLVTESMNLIEPHQGNAPVIFALIRGLLKDESNADNSNAQVHTFCGWLQSSVRALRAGRFVQDQALAIAGPKDCGKSLVQHHIITPCLAGRAVNGEKFFLRGNDFNSDLYRAEHITMDDCQASTKISDRLAFGAKLKGATVGSAVGDLHGKGKDGVAIRPWWRVSVTVNDDPEALLVLPPLNADIADKIILLKARQFEMPMPTRNQEEREKFAAAIRAEIPAFLHFLLHEYEIPEQFRDPRRYGVATYHHPELVELLDGLSPEKELLDLIDTTLFDDPASVAIRISADDLENKIRNRHPYRANKLFWHSQACGKYLHRLSNKHPDRIDKNATNKGKLWRISPATVDNSESDGCDR